MLIFLDKEGKRVNLDDPNAMIAEVKIANEAFVARANTNNRVWPLLGFEEVFPDTPNVLKLDAELIKRTVDARFMVNATKQKQKKM